MTTAELAQASPVTAAARPVGPGAHRCHSCGYASAEPAFFRVEVVHGRKCTLCAGCGPVDRRFLLTAGAVVGLTLAPLGAILQAWDAEGYGLICLLFGGYYLSTLFAAPLHELGHALAVLAMRGRLDAIRFGAGDEMRTYRLGEVRIELGAAFPIGGHCSLYWDNLNRHNMRAIVVLLAGAMANLGGAAAIFALVRLFSVNLTASPGLLTLAVGAMLAQAYVAVRSLWPSRDKNDRPGTDGWQILCLLRSRSNLHEVRRALAGIKAGVLVRRNQVADAERFCLEEWRLDPGSGVVLGCLLHCKLWLDGPEVATRWHLDHAAAVVATTADDQSNWTGAWANIAYNALLSGLPEAESVAAEAVARARAIGCGLAVLDGVEGMLKLRGGDPLAALPLLRAGAQGSEGSDKAAFCPSLAAAEDALGRPEMALQFTLLGRHLRAGEPPVQQRRAP